MKCKAAEWHMQNIESAHGFSDHEICGIADTQVRRVLNHPEQSADQRDFDRLVRREIRRRGLPWRPPGKEYT